MSKHEELDVEKQGFSQQDNQIIDDKGISHEQQGTKAGNDYVVRNGEAREILSD